jgi:acyl phosphate:glycerol-3-phosphate acyltransferase
VTPEALNMYWWIPVAAYLIGSIPFGYLIIRQTGQGDIRSVGSGNVGATNVARAAGARAGALTFLLDGAKGALAVWIAAQITGDSVTWMMAAALGAMVGHICPVWLSGRGGRGVSTGVGAFILICWPAVAAAILIWLMVVSISRYVSLASIMAAASLPLLMYFLYAPGHAPSFVVSGGTTLASLLIILKHRPNIARLVNGKETRFDFHRSPRGQQN